MATIKLSGLSSADETVTLPVSVEIRSGSATAHYDGHEDVVYDSLEALCAHHGLEVSTFRVALDVSALTGEAWDSWCDSSPVDGIVYDAVQGDGREHWTVLAPTEELARALVAATIAGSPVEVVSLVQA